MVVQCVTSLIQACKHDDLTVSDVRVERRLRWSMCLYLEREDVGWNLGCRCIHPAQLPRAAMLSLICKMEL